MRYCIARGVSLILTSIALSGCFSYNNAYIGPTDGPRARLRLSTDGVIRLMPNSACVNWNTPGIGVGPYQELMLPLPLSKANNGASLAMPIPAAPESLVSSELYVRAGEPILIFYQKQTKTKASGREITLFNCDSVYVFTPESGQDYVGFFAGVENGDRCITSIAKFAEPPVAIKDAYDAAACKK